MELTSSQIRPIFFIIFISLISVSSSLPFVVLHGPAESCSNISDFTEQLGNLSGTQGYCIEIGGGTWDSWVMPLMQQVDIACNKIKNIDELSDGYNMVARSQGNMVGRGVIEFCDGAPLVNNFIGLGGPQAGVASCPRCHSELICDIVNIIMELEVYSAYVQEHLAPSNYVKIPTEYDSYIKGNKFLPRLNNEIEETRNSTYKERFSSLEKLILVMFENDTVLVPKETSWFGYYKNGSLDTILKTNETKLYTEDWIGLKTLVEAGKVEFVSTPGGHIEITESLMENYIVPYLETDESENKKKMMMVNSHRRFGYRFSSFMSSFMQLFYN